MSLDLKIPRLPPFSQLSKEMDEQPALSLGSNKQKLRTWMTRGWGYYSNEVWT